jgi:aminoglycoside phosphotransferase (APT) family kinase protein
MTSQKMHADEIDISADVVATLITEQFPQWADLPLRRVPSTGTVNALYRLGDELVVRLCRVPWAVHDLPIEQRWLPRLAPYLPVAIPAPVALGEPGPGYPWQWSVMRWLPGTNPAPGRLEDPYGLAADLAAFVRAVWAIDLPDAPPAYRGGPLSDLDSFTRRSIAQLDGAVDVSTVTAIWDEAVQAPVDEPNLWLHADLMPGNLLTVDGRLSAVIDFATAGVGDPTCDLIPAWLVLPAGARDAFRAALEVDDATWRRARARTLAMSLGGLAYYGDIEPTLAAQARYGIDETIADYRANG